MGPWTFTNAGATGRLGPTQEQIDANYSGSTLEGLVTINSTYQGIQEWTVPAEGSYTIEVYGAEGGDSTNFSGIGGKGARMKGDFELNESVVLKILVGQKGSSYGWDGAGGGGTFVSHSNNTPIIVAGGGGGSSSNSYGGSGLTGTSGGASIGGHGLGGTDGGGGVAQSSAASGAGFTGNGQPGSSTSHLGYSFANGGNGGDGSQYAGFDGGFGGGGSSHGGGWGGGGGGGYSGGGAYYYPYGGGGGGSYNSGTNQENQAGVNEGHGKVIISFIGN
jgi:hypothetical protein